MELFKNENDRINSFLLKKLGSDNIIMETSIMKSKLNQNQFTDLLKKIKNGNYKLQSEEGNNSYLRITMRESNLEIKIYGDKNITKYCDNNKIVDLEDNLEINDIFKGRDGKFYISNYNLELEIREEKRVTKKSTRGAKVLNELFKNDKYFKYIKTYSFTNEEDTFQINFNISKSSNKEDFINKGGKILKKEVKFNKKKYVKKPKDEKRSFSIWWNSLDNEAEIEMSDEKYSKAVTFKKLSESGTLENQLEYNINIIFLGNCPRKEASKKFMIEIENLLKVVQKSDNLISEYQIRQLKGKYKSLTGQFNFRASIPFSKTLETKHIVRLENTDYQNNINIRRNYCVTEKADGERCLLYVDDEGDVYLINRQELPRKTGMKLKNCKNSLLDGEYLTKLKGGYDVKLYLVFDLYFLDGEDFRERILMRQGNQKSEESGIEKSRLEVLDDMIKMMEIIGESPMEIRKKEFMFGDTEGPSDNGLKRIEKYKIACESLEDDSDKEEIMKEIDMEKKDTKIFSHACEILDRINSDDYEYETDGLIFTPINLTVGEEPETNKRNKYGGRWGRVFKWKMSDENSIDFLVEFAKDVNGEYVEKVFMEDMKKYRKVYLKVAYDNKNNLVNRAKIINEKPMYAQGYHSILFEPTTNFVPRTFECYLEVTKNGGLVCHEPNGNVGDVIKDGTIVEFYYDFNPNQEINKDPRFRWVPMRRRENSVPNSLETALNIWNSIYEPISTENICTGYNLNKVPGEYYSSDVNEKNIYKSFHNLLKKNLINSVSIPAGTLLDLGSGECGDLHKWLGTDLYAVVGIEYNNYNINNNMNGGFKRIIQATNNERYKDKELVKNIFLIWGDAGKNILDGSCGLDKLNKFYLDVLMGNQLDAEMRYLLRSPKLKDNIGRFKGGFNIVSCQFCMHYFFQNKTTLYNFLTNISQNLVIGGKFIGTCFDGRKIFNLLEKKDFVEQKTNEGKLLWKIEKKYRDKLLSNDEYSLGKAIGVYVNTFNNMEQEYLVNLDYLEKILPEFGLELETSVPFEKHYNEFLANGTLGEENTLSKEASVFSFMNMSLTIVKTKAFEEMKGGNEESKMMVEKFLTNKSLLDTEEEGFGLKILDEDVEEEEVSKQFGGRILDLDNFQTDSIPETADTEVDSPVVEPSTVENTLDLGDIQLDSLEEINIDSSPSVSDMEPVKVDMEPVKVDMEPVKVDMEPVKVDMEPVKVDMEPVTVEPKQVEFNSEPAKVETVEPNNMKVENLREIKLDELNLDSNPQKGGNPIVSPNVKVIKISADAGTLNMINK